MRDASANSNDDLDLNALVDDAKAEAKISAEGLSAQELDALVHKLTAMRLVEALQNSEVMHTPGLLQAAMRFCVDNKVTGLDVPEAAGAAVRAAYKDKAPFKLAQ